jgi:uncharacterized protein (DUF427 family)
MGRVRTSFDPLGWQYFGQRRPPFAVEPAPGEESVWDYPRPPRVVPEPREVVVRVAATIIARSRNALRVLETASPPTVYVPRDDVMMEFLRPALGASSCEWKGSAIYWSVILPGEERISAAWSYEDPHAGFEPLRGHLSFYPGRVECELGGVPVRPQPGGFYGGWVTPEIVGPFKGEPGTHGW